MRSHVYPSPPYAEVAAVIARRWRIAARITRWEKQAAKRGNGVRALRLRALANQCRRKAYDMQSSLNREQPRKLAR